ncbi:hypothetical protein [Parvularcula marina]|uniref:Uncharacterized protein n=1 Tax=Parvularcula marina TaxID=2292771 RepID=A0A371RIV2_9PROT|nr:hypothetical protein [Parvularcula marina]RFB05387.1 hypothetical protein DX908_09025 [Parvularcula marina]
MSIGDLERNASDEASPTKGSSPKWAAIPSVIFVIYYLLQMSFPDQIAARIPNEVHAGILIAGAASFILFAWQLMKARKS